MKDIKTRGKSHPRKINTNNYNPIERRKILSWIPPTVLAATIPQHAHASGKPTTTSGPPSNFNTEPFCTEIDLGDVLGSVYFNIEADHVIVTFTVFGDDFVTVTGVGGINPDTGDFKVGVDFFGTEITIVGTAPAQGTTTINFEMIVDNGPTIPGTANAGGGCPIIDDYSLCTGNRPTRDNIPISSGQTLSDQDAITWSFTPTPALPTTNSVTIEIHVSCDGGSYTQVGTAEVSNSVPAEYTNTGAALCPGVGLRTVDVQAKFIGGENVSECDHTVTVSSV